MKKAILLTLFTAFISLTIKATIINVPIEQRIDESDYVVEATVLEKFSYWNEASNFIYTAQKLKVHKIYKGAISENEIFLITEGGVVETNALNVNPNLETSIGQSGIFFISDNNSWDKPQNINKTYYSKTGPLGFIFYDRNKENAFDNLNNWGSVEGDLLPKIKYYTGQEDIFSAPEKPYISPRRATPVITSFSPAEIHSGTQEVLTITGTGFGASRNGGVVLFPDANNGGSAYMAANPGDYISWTDTEIKLRLHTRAGTGEFKVVESGGGEATSGTDLIVPWAHLNINNYYHATYVPDTSSFELRHISTNGNGGLTWVWNKTFHANDDAVAAFVRAMESWRCQTLINWDTLGITANDTMLKDGEYVVFFDTKGWMPSSTLGVCYSWYSGCFFPTGGMEWYVSELDIVFKENFNWEYGPALPTGGKTDFESVALHELGHGHQLGHVINKDNVMNWSMSPNKDIRVLQENDTACGNYVMRKSVSAVCNQSAMQLIDESECVFTPPVPAVADFTVDKTDVCANDVVIFTDLSTGDIDFRYWNFGLGASPATATGKGPHTVTYSIGGKKDVKLVVGTLSDSDSLENKAMITVKSTSQPVADFTYNFVRGCEMDFEVINPIATSTYTWNFGNQGTKTGKEVSFTFNGNGPINVELETSNNCGSITEIKEVNFICTDFMVSTDEACISDTITFINLSNVADELNWDFGNNASPATATGVGPHKVAYSTGGSKVVSLTTKDSKSEQTVTESITIKNSDRTKAEFNLEHKGDFGIQFNNTSIGIGNTYSWNFGDGNTSTEENPFHKYNSDPIGLVVTLESTNECDNGSYTQTLSSFASVKNQLANNWNIFPSPADKVLTVKSIKNTNIHSIRIIDLQGKEVINQSINNSVSEYTLDISNLSSATYIIVINSSEGTYKQTIIKN